LKAAFRIFSAKTTSLGIPADAVYEAQLGGDPGRWETQPSIMEDLKRQAKSLGIWNIFLPHTHGKHGGGFSNLEYGLMAEQLGKSVVASEVREPQIVNLVVIIPRLFKLTL
jgi:alkylation response protein AidB-like acyl-CoA dehydrogenase